MSPTLFLTGLSAWLLAPGGASRPEGFLHPLPAATQGEMRECAPYVPREGDLIFYDDRSQVWTALFALAGTGPPLHMGIVVKQPDGTPAILEAGPDDTVWVKLLDAGPRLRQFHRDFAGMVTVRRCKVALSSEKSAALTRFARAQEGKRYAVLRLLLQGTPLRARGPLAPLLARTDLDRQAWICSELAVAAGTVAGLFDPCLVPANATYPRDLVDNCRHDLGAIWEDAAEWRPGVSCGKLPVGRKGGDAMSAPPGRMSGPRRAGDAAP
jgi:hypothetical protein